MIVSPLDGQENHSVPATLTLGDISRAVRTRQWAKNSLLLAGFIFAGRLRAPDGGPALHAEVARLLLALTCFCALSGAAYLINDWNDLTRDRAHPIKRNRPLASGRMSARVALSLIVVQLGIAVLLAGLICLLNPASWGFAMAGACYFGLTLAYSAALKHEVILDVITVAAGFVIRVVAGCLVIPVAISPWIVFCTFNLALFIALCKRRAELLEMGQSGETRSVLPHYTVSMLDTFIGIAAALTIIAYSLYTFNAPHTKVLGAGLQNSPLLMTTIPFVVYGVFRYLLLAHSSPVGGEPEQVLRDRPLVCNVALWAVWVAVLTLLEKL